MRLENKRMVKFLKENNIRATAKYIWKGSLKGCWRLTNIKQKWTKELQEKLTQLGFKDYDDDLLDNFSGNGGYFSVFVKGHTEFLINSA